MKRISLLVATIIGAALAQTSAQAAPLAARPGVQSAVVKATFFVDRKKDKHAAHKHRHHAHKHAHLKNAPPKPHKKH